MPECVSNTCCAADSIYAANNLAEWSETDLPLPWAYYLMGEGAESPTRIDATGQVHDMESGELVYPPRVEGRVTPWANEFDGTNTFATPLATMDTLADSWAFHCWLYLGTPAADATLLTYATATPNQIELRQFWDGVNLSFRLQAGYYAPPNDAIPYYNIVTLTNLTAPLNKWYFIVASYGGGQLTLAVDAAVSVIPSLDLDAVIPPVHAETSDIFLIGENFVGKMGPIGIWTPDDYLSSANIAKLWRGGLGLGLRF